MRKNEKYTNLREKTIFDFTRDNSILKEILYGYEEYVEDPETAIEESKYFQPIANVRMILEFAEITNNKTLYRALRDEFEDEYPQYFYEEKGILIN
jgi:hypothetical protein